MRKTAMFTWMSILLLFLICPAAGLAQPAKGGMGDKPHDPQAMMERMRDKGMAEGMAGKPMLAPCGKPCPNCPMAGGGGMMHGGMMEKMNREFFLDRVGELGLTEKQVASLTGLRNSCRQDNIRAAAELKIARLELADMLAGDWKLAEAEKLVRKIHSIEADMEVRHLRARQDAEKTLDSEQLRKARSAAAPGELEELFQ